jgi:hypothetical protein
LLRGRGTSFQDGVAAVEGFPCCPFWCAQICDYSAAWVSCTDQKRSKTQNNVFFKPCTKLTLHWNHRTQNGQHGKPSPAATPSWKLVSRPLSKREVQTGYGAWKPWAVAAADRVYCVCVEWEIHFLITFETAPIFSEANLSDSVNPCKLFGRLRSSFYIKSQMLCS